MNIKVHLIAERKFLEDLPELVELIEQAYTPSSVEVVRLDQPYVTTVVHFFAQRKLARDCVLVLRFRLVLVVYSDILVYLFQLLLGGVRSMLQFHLLDTVVVLAKTINFVYEIL